MEENLFMIKESRTDMVNIGGSAGGAARALFACRLTSQSIPPDWMSSSVEWNIGEAAGALAAFCIEGHYSPDEVYEKPEIREKFQSLLQKEGVELSWPSNLL